MLRYSRNQSKLSKIILSQKDLFIQRTTGVPFLVWYPTREICSGLGKYWPQTGTKSIAFYNEKQQDTFAWLTPESDYRNTGIVILENLVRFQATFREWKGVVRQLDLLLGWLETHDNWDQKFVLFDRLYRRQYLLALPLEGMTVYGDEFVQNMRTKYPKAHKAIATLTKPLQPTFIMEYECAIAELALQSNELQSQGAQRVVKQFQWILNNYRDYNVITTKYVLHDVQQAKKNHTSQQLRAKIHALAMYIRHQRRAVAGIKQKKIFLPQDYEKLFWIGKSAWWMDQRKKYNLRSNAVLTRYLEKKARTWHCKLHDLQFLLPEEVQRQPSAKLLQTARQRRKASMYVETRNGVYGFLLGNNATKTYEKINAAFVQRHASSELQGTIAHPGVVRGRVRIIHAAKDGSTFKKGEILVTSMTRPDFIALMKLASAIITDEGGITSHAAIVSRELKKPCIIGTKIATKVLHDGDLVEVDAEKGIVRKIG